MMRYLKRWLYPTYTEVLTDNKCKYFEHIGSDGNIEKFRWKSQKYGIKNLIYVKDTNIIKLEDLECFKIFNGKIYYIDSMMNKNDLIKELYRVAGQLQYIIK